MSANEVSILEGNTFVVSDRRGDIDASPTSTHGLFSMDTRFLSRWILRVDGRLPNPLSTDDLEYFSAQFFLVPGTGTVYVDSPVSIVRRRAVGRGFHEDLSIYNHTNEPREMEVRIEVGADFADLFEVKDALKKKGLYHTRIENGRIVLGYQREEYIRETWISCTEPAALDEQGLSFHVKLAPHGTWSVGLDVTARGPGGGLTPKYRSSTETPRPDMGESLQQWLDAAPKLACSWRPLEVVYRRSLVDLAALRFNTLMFPGQSLPAAGLPWFMAVFGRDSIITSLQALPFEPSLAATTLRVLAARQGVTIDDFRDEEPGRILHEVRLGEMTAFEERPHSPYYGTSDATPLFLVLLDEYHRWTGDHELVRKLEASARAALRWIDEFGDRDGDGYVEYERRNKETGLENQCWKDSWNSILFSDGSLAPLPRATCEIQGYVYDAKRRAARLARKVWNDPAFADRLEAEAARLKEDFNRDFWIEDRRFFALALDGKKRKVDSLTSNIGHLLWSGIADNDKARACVEHLMSDRLFSGWGIRTMAEGEGGYNPIGYHVGTVWPHDCSMIAWGLRKYGYHAEAARIAMGILDATPYFNHRLPEAFAGYPRQATHFPVEYPTACSPQAWATGAPLLLIATLLGLQPIAGRLLSDPAVPKEIEHLELLNIKGPWGAADAFARGLIDLREAATAAPETRLEMRPAA